MCKRRRGRKRQLEHGKGFLRKKKLRDAASKDRTLAASWRVGGGKKGWGGKKVQEAAVKDTSRSAK